MTHIPFSDPRISLFNDRPVEITHAHCIEAWNSRNCKKQHVETPVSESYEPVHGEFQFNYDLSIATDQLIPNFLKGTNYNV